MARKKLTFDRFQDENKANLKIALGAVVGFADPPYAPEQVDDLASVVLKIVFSMAVKGVTDPADKKRYFIPKSVEAAFQRIRGVAPVEAQSGPDVDKLVATPETYRRAGEMVTNFAVSFAEGAIRHQMASKPQTPARAP
ncbi:MAG: hypothetical protein P4M15_03600 [Alphaproteobacteria bacterium]|nr:hypothetical protein [Alphaproteobacteria bacterium]